MSVIHEGKSPLHIPDRSPEVVGLYRQLIDHDREPVELDPPEGFHSFLQAAEKPLKDLDRERFGDRSQKISGCCSTSRQDREAPVPSMFRADGLPRLSRHKGL